MRLRVHCKAGHSLPGSHGRNQRGYTEALLRSVRKFKQAKRFEKSHPAKHRNPPKALPLPPTSIEHILHYGHLASTLAQRPAGNLRMDSRAHHPDRGGCQSGSASRSFLIRWDGHLGDHAYVRHGHVRHGIDAPALPPRLRPPFCPVSHGRCTRCAIFRVAQFLRKHRSPSFSGTQQIASMPRNNNQ